MRPLLRPFLFALARLGVFLSAVAWIVSQTFLPRLTLPIGNRHVLFLLAPEGALFLNWDRPENLEVEWFRKSELEPYEIEHLSTMFTPMDNGEMFTAEYSSFGVTIGKMQDTPVLSFRHWLITTVFVTVNVVLYITYRKRPELRRREE